VAGKPLSMHDRKLAPRWAEAASRVLWECAPWRLASALEEYEEPRVLSLLPGQRHQRKAAFVLTRGPTGPQIDIEYTGSNRRVPESAWRRELCSSGTVAAAIVRRPKREPASTLPLAALLQEDKHDKALALAKEASVEDVAGELRPLIAGTDTKLACAALAL